MAGYTLLYTEPFSAVDTITVTHNQNSDYLNYRVVVDADAQLNLVAAVAPVVGNERNAFIVKLTSVQSGRVQVLLPDIAQVNVEPGALRSSVRVTSADTVPGFLSSKIVSDGTVGLTVLDPGGDEQLQLAVDLTQTFAAQEIEESASDSTSSTTPQNAFVSPAQITIPADGAGDYLVLFESAYKLSNNNGIGEISVGLNGLTSVAGSERSVGGNKNGGVSLVKRLNGLVEGDIIYGLYNRVSGGGSITVYGRSLTAFRISVP